jgi:hypothetical protein
VTDASVTDASVTQAADDSSSDGDADASASESDAGDSTSADPTGAADSTGDETTTETTSAPPTDDGTTIADEVDVGVPGPCDTYDPMCPEGFKCMPYADDGGSSWNAQFCFPLDPDPVGVGEPCEVVGDGVSGLDDCEEGSMCWFVDPDTNEGTCVAFCGGTPDDPDCDAAHTCLVANDEVLNLCMPFCDPVLQDCDAGYGCYPMDDGFVCAVDASGEMGSFGDVCEFINVCDPGLACITGELVLGCTEAGCCTPFCDLDDPTPCSGISGGVECVPWYLDGDAPAGFEDVGICLES